MAIGEPDGQRLAISVDPAVVTPGKTGGTGLPLAIGLELLCRGSLRDPGVHAHEAVIDTGLVLRRLPTVRGRSATELTQLERMASFSLAWSDIPQVDADWPY